MYEMRRGKHVLEFIPLCSHYSRCLAQVHESMLNGLFRDFQKGNGDQPVAGGGTSGSGVDVQNASLPISCRSVRVAVNHY